MTLLASTPSALRRPSHTASRSVVALTVGSAAVLAVLAGPVSASPGPGVTLESRAVLPPRTFVPGPTSGQYAGPDTTGVRTPFVDAQPVQGISGQVPYDAAHPDGTSWALSDNGYGTLQNSSDFLLRMDRVRPAGRGVQVLSTLTLSDPQHRMPGTIVHEYTDRVLTGADADPESLQQAQDGTFWIGEEFGPSLLHVDRAGRLLAAPYRLPDAAGGLVRSPQDPQLEEFAAVRTMDALRERAASLGDTKPLVVSPDYHLLAGVPGNPVSADRTAPTADPALPPADSALFDPVALAMNALPPASPAASPAVRSGFATVPYTVDDPADIARLVAYGARPDGSGALAGLISDYPERVYAALAADPLRRAAIRPDGTVDRTRFDLQAHRGGRGDRPENTLGSFEHGLDVLATTLETDDAITRDGVLVLSHDPYVNADTCRRTDGTAYGKADQVLIHDLTVTQLQSRFVCDKTLATYPAADHDPAHSPLAARFAATRGLGSPFVIPTTQQLVDFVGFYASAKGGVAAANARTVHFNLETKTNPRPEYAARTAPASVFATKLGTFIQDNGLTDRADVQSFDLRELLQVQRQFPAIQTVYLFGDSPDVPGTEGADGTNLEPLTPGGVDSPWLAGLTWPYRRTVVTTPAVARQSGGFEGLALSPDGTTLYAALEQATTDRPGVAQIAQFDLATQEFTGKRWYYPYSALPGSVPGGPGSGFSLDDLQLVPTRDGHLDGVAVERDGTGGALAVSSGLKRVYEIAFDETAPATTVAKRLVADLERVADPLHVAGGRPGDVGITRGSFAETANTIEGLTVLAPNRLLVTTDNNFPFDGYRRPGQPDGTDVLVLDLPRPLGSLRPEAPAS